MVEDFVAGVTYLEYLQKERCMNANHVFHNNDLQEEKEIQLHSTERGGSMVTHETRIREVPGSNPGADQPDWGFFVVFLSHQGECWVGF